MGKRTQYSSYCRECGRGTNKMVTCCLGPGCTGRLVSRGVALETLNITPEELDARNAPKPDTCPRCGAVGMLGYELICCCHPDAIQEITDEHELPLQIRLKPPAKPPENT